MSSTPRSETSALVIAPYCPAPSSGLISLGAAAKIKCVLLGMGLRFEGRVTLINSGHQDEKLSGPRRVELNLVPGQSSVCEVIPPTLPVRAVGKALQALLAPLEACRFAADDSCRVLWLYNPYLFESVFGLTFKLLRPDTTVILEFEDSPDSRSRSLLGNFKILLDALAYRSIAATVDLWTVVNRQMPLPAQVSPARVRYLPILVDGAAVQAAAGAKPEKGPALGYFGGLSSEKGADLVGDLIPLTAGYCTWDICGTGPLASRFVRIAAAQAGVTFHGALEEPEFRRVFSRVDAVLNFHKPLDSFSNGVFPYKVLEAVAWGKVVISTPLEGCPEEIRNTIRWVPPSDTMAWKEAVASLDIWRRENFTRLQEAASWVIRNYSYDTCVPDLVDQALGLRRPERVI